MVDSPYLLEEKIETNKWLQVIRGNSRQILPMTWVSNQPMAEEVSITANVQFEGLPFNTCWT